MSKQYPGGIISKTAPVPSGPYADSTAPGIWTLEQQAALAKQGNWPTAGNVNPSLFIENLFNTWLYTGNDTTQVITNGVNLSANGGLVWAKGRSGATNHILVDTARGTSSGLITNDVGAAGSSSGFTSFDTTGFTFGGGAGARNNNGTTYAAWTFRKQPKFFDIVTYTGTGSARTVAHNLGSVPGAIIVKCTSTARDWAVYHRSTGGTKFLKLNDISLAATASSLWNNTDPSSTTFTVGSDQDTNGSGLTYVAYLFAHDAGGFGLTGTDNVISCGSYTTDGSGNATVSLGYEPQWVLNKTSSSDDNWTIADNMRGFSVTNEQRLYPNLSNAEAAATTFRPTATGYTVNSGEVSKTYIYIAIRRGPMAVPTVGTSVYNANIFPANSATNNTVINPGFPVDLVFMKPDKTGDYNWYWQDRLRGQKYLYSNATNAEVNSSTAFDYSNGYVQTLTNGTDGIGWSFRRAPSFFDVVCWTGDNGSNQRVNHNLGVVPELIIYKGRNKVNYWRAYYGNINKYIVLNLDSAETSGSNLWGSSAPTTTDFGINCGSMDLDNFNAVAYLFATCAGVSKVGSYTGNAGNTVTVPCGFTSGVRFVLIKRTDSTGGWYVWDSARGIIPGNDPYLLLNSTAAEVGGTDYVDTYAAGFEVTSTAPAALNATGGTYIFLAIA